MGDQPANSNDDTDNLETLEKQLRAQLNELKQQRRALQRRLTRRATIDAALAACVGDIRAGTSPQITQTQQRAQQLQQKLRTARLSVDSTLGYLTQLTGVSVAEYAAGIFGEPPRGAA